jgi:hypothetical protein
VASSAAAPKTNENGAKPADDGPDAEKKKEDEFSSKAQVMTLMTTDVDRVSEFAWHLFSLVDAPIEIIIGSVSVVQPVVLGLGSWRRRFSCTICWEYLRSSACSSPACSFRSITLRARSWFVLKMVSVICSSSSDHGLTMRKGLMEARDERVALMNEVGRDLLTMYLHWTNHVRADSRRHSYDQIHGVGALIREAGDEVCSAAL